MEFRWDGPQQVKNLGDNPTRSQINALFAIPGATKSESSLPHHDVSADGKVGAADVDGCTAAISALNGAHGTGVNASQAEKNKAYSHLASHIRAAGQDPPEKKFAAPGHGLELRAQRRASMLRVPERLALQFGASGIEMRARPNGTGGTSFQFDGYAAVFDNPFEMWDFWGDPFSEIVNQGAFTRTLANSCDVPFLIGHNDAGIPMARTKSGTMTLGQDTHGLHVHIPALDGSREDVRALASAHERGDMDEMSCAFWALQQVWSPDYEQRNLIEMDLHKGDVSAVVFGANDGTAGSSVVALPAEQLHLRRPVGMLRNRRPGETRSADEIIDNGGPPDSNINPNGATAVKCPYTVANGCGKMNAGNANFCDGCGGPLYQGDGTLVIDDSGVVEPEGSGSDADQQLAARRRELELLALSA